MTHRDNDSTAEEWVALYLAGALPHAEADEFERRIAAGWPEADALLRRSEGVVTALARALEPVEPPPAVREALLGRIGPPPGVLVRHAGEGGFKRTRFPGVGVRLLHIDHGRGQLTCLLKLDAGAVLPAHPHDGPEECVVLDGEIIVGGVRLRRGDYQRVEAGTDHDDQRTDIGALLFLTAPLSLFTD